MVAACRGWVDQIDGFRLALREPMEYYVLDRAENDPDILGVDIAFDKERCDAFHVGSCDHPSFSSLLKPKPLLKFAPLLDLLLQLLAFTLHMVELGCWRTILRKERHFT